MKAPHPPAPTPHRGYSAPGAEKVYSADDLRTQEQERGGAGAAEREVSEQLRRIRDCKESFEVGSERNAAQPNVWLPEAVLPGFRAFATDFYWRLDGTAKCVLDALATGLELADEERRGFLAAHSGDNNQLRLLHYPAVEARMLGEGVVGRMPAHRDWSTFTLDFQDGVGGLEVRGPGVGSGFVAAGPVPGACVLNVGDMLERFTNGACSCCLSQLRGDYMSQRTPAAHALQATEETTTAEGRLIRNRLLPLGAPPRRPPAPPWHATRDPAPLLDPLLRRAGFGPLRRAPALLRHPSAALAIRAHQVRGIQRLDLEALVRQSRGGVTVAGETSMSLRFWLRVSEHGGWDVLR